MLRQRDEHAPPVARVRVAQEQPFLRERLDPAQRRGGRYGGGDAQAGDGDAAPLLPGCGEVQQYVPGGIGEQVAAEELLANAARADEGPDGLGADLGIPLH